MKRTTLFNFLLFVGVLLSGVLWWYLHQPAQAVATNAKPIPDLVLRNVIAVHLNENGVPQYALQTPLVTHHPADNTTDFATPHVTLYSEPQNPWQLQAASGKANADFSQIQLAGNVYLHQPAGLNNVENTATTNNITFYPQRKFAQTDQFVKFWQAKQMMQGIGMQANMQQGWVKLLDKVEGIYAAQ